MASFWGSTASKAGTFALGTAEGAVKGGAVGLIGGGVVGGLLGGAGAGFAAFGGMGLLLQGMTGIAAFTKIAMIGTLLSPAFVPVVVVAALAGAVWGGGIGAGFLAPLSAAISGIFGGAKRLGQANAIDENNKVAELSGAKEQHAAASEELKQTIADANARKAAFGSFDNPNATTGHGDKVLDAKKMTTSQFLGAGGS